MFIGEYHHVIDDKGRLIMPARFREELGERFIVTRGLDNCLFVYPLRGWEEMEQKLKSLPFTRADVRAFVRFFFSGATECELDRQGRILVPANLREYARLEKDVVIAGVSSRVEIWSRELWEQYLAATAAEYEALAEKMVDLNI
ncbi:MAG: division/cell wall cluster transcriptional repressor MraZ [Thermoanaerobacteraceae bacterium]|uniref:division/cell wall cluster transcriptional repressor MraZ n=1 Tax=Thermanaeromonas sp. C210 TaxID=2731925 RepID=UPI00155CA56B|nr:division/cell wall cluster transcriptional repressor MraZ [Thermanaeromonas sp. C210]MBE3581856.1 division/cell wall cluster transcriptional repressor MraZ [Thermoanaerobacteraceae bacterium]GFN24085.1 transcriptional regulator MraZ [Thermanaeromonas sp. C210]